MADIIDTEVEVNVQTALIEFNREELEMLHNVLYRVQLGMNGYANAASNVLGVLDDLLGDIAGADHEVGMHTRYENSLFWGSI